MKNILKSDMGQIGEFCLHVVMVGLFVDFGIRVVEERVIMLC